MTWQTSSAVTLTTNKSMIWSKPMKKRQSFSTEAEQLVLRAEDSGNEKLLDRAQKMLDKATSQKEKFLAKVDRRGLKNAEKIANESAKEAAKAAKGSS